MPIDVVRDAIDQKTKPPDSLGELDLVAAFGRCHLNAVFTAKRKDAMETCEVDLRLRHQSS